MAKNTTGKGRRKPQLPKPKLYNPKGGRPLFDGKDYETVLQKLQTAWSMDLNDSRAAAFAEISPAALSDFLKKHPEVSEKKRQLKAKPILKAHATIINNLDDIKVAQWYLEKRDPDNFGEKIVIAHDDESFDEEDVKILKTLSTHVKGKLREKYQSGQARALPDKSVA